MRPSYRMRVRAGLCLCALAAAVARAAAPAATGPDDAAVAHACPGLAAWVARRPPAPAAAAATAAPTEPQLRAELLAMADRDQQARSALLDPGKPAPAVDPQVLQALKDVDDRNLVALYRLVADYGLPTPAMVGADGLKAFWLLVQHAQDTRLQRRVLEAFGAADSGIPPQEIALLDDRLSTTEGRPQKYGSQFRTEGQAMVMAPVEDEAHLDERRERMGLPPIADYRCMLRLMYGGTVR